MNPTEVTRATQKIVSKEGTLSIWVLQVHADQVGNCFGTVCILCNLLRDQTIKESEEVW